MTSDSGTGTQALTARTKPGVHHRNSETEDYLKVKDDYAWNTHALRPNTFIFLGVKKDIWERWLDHKINSQGNNATTKP